MADDENKEESPAPKRKWSRWKTWTIIAIVVILLPILIWATADMAMNYQISAEFERYRAAGQPAKFEDFASPEVPDDQNATIPISNAAGLLSLDTKQYEILYYKLNLAFVKANPTIVDEIISRNTACDAELRKSRTLNRYSQNLKPTSPKNLFQMLPKDYANYRAMVKLRALCGLNAIAKGDSVAAAEYLRDVESIIKSWGDVYNFNGFTEQIATERDFSIIAAEGIIPHLKKPGGRTDFDKLTAELDLLKAGYLNETQLVHLGKMAFYSERLVFKDTIYRILSGEFAGRANHYGMKFAKCEPYARIPCSPLIKKRIFNNIKIENAASQAVAATNFPEAIKIISDACPSNELFESGMDYILNNIWPDVLYSSEKNDSNIVEIFFGTLAMRRMAAVAIAMKQYEWDKGTPPTSLGDLTPKYLPAVPLDPFSAKGEPIKLGAWGGRRLVYSVGENGIDESGQYASKPEECHDWGQFDMPFFLDGNRPGKTSPKTTTATAPASAPATP